MSEHSAENSDEEQEFAEQANKALFRIRAQNTLGEQDVGDNMAQNPEEEHEMLTYSEFENLEPLTGGMFDEHDVDFSDTPFAAGMAVWDMMEPSGWYGPLEDEKEEEEERLSGGICSAVKVETGKDGRDGEKS